MNNVDTEGLQLGQRHELSRNRDDMMERMAFSIAFIVPNVSIIAIGSFVQIQCFGYILLSQVQTTVVLTSILLNYSTLSLYFPNRVYIWAILYNLYIIATSQFSHQHSFSIISSSQQVSHYMLHLHLQLHCTIFHHRTYHLQVGCQVTLSA